jgi:hypothetical protein
LLCGVLAGAAGAVPPSIVDERDALADLWAGTYDISEELVASEDENSPLAPLAEQQRLQINVRRISLPWLGSHVLYFEESPFDEPFEIRRRVLLSLEPPDRDGAIHVRQFTRKTDASNTGPLRADDIESIAACDLWLQRAGGQFRGGTRGRECPDRGARGARWLDYRVVIGDGLFWYRKRRLTLPQDDLIEEVAGFPHVELEDARLFSCGVSWADATKHGPRRALAGVELHDRGGRARIRTPDGRELTLELHGRDWPLSEGRESLVLLLSDGRADSDPIASSWTSLGAARVGIDIGWLAIDCAPVVSETGERHS